MQFFIIVLILCLFIFLFSLYLLSNEDFVFLRRDVSMEKIFNIALITAIFSIFGARLFFMASNPSSSFFNPLIFFLFPYFPGLSLVGAVWGGVVGTFVLCGRDGKIPTLRLFDFFSVSLLSALPIGLLGYFLLSNNIFYLHNISLIFIYIALFIFFIKFFLPFMVKGELREGTLTYIFLLCFSVITFTERFIARIGDKIYFNFEDLSLVVTFIVFSILLAQNEKLIAKIKKR